MEDSPPAARCDTSRHADVPALKGWANIGRRFATTGSWPVTFYVTDNIRKEWGGGQGFFIENGKESLPEY
jgi:hypothetical protein